MRPENEAYSHVTRYRIRNAYFFKRLTELVAQLLHLIQYGGICGSRYLLYPVDAAVEKFEFYMWKYRHESD